ncbi:hypothetical protein HYH02_011674 [Chlamydomonas schloesseri]|uniref:Uncharacterized protein n=1 Tax=Chlamydomonas schloesseri TaxID=2026947 RepID=A0A835TC61_9CHLO|nr:hypothetical protein HYH02_011674 [Chlamydomonas schloesseri]|eukprot:KAG2436170.1 hypothetical protein HYH02_011674 [Chlamydomonas schloesseri]
MGGGDRRSVTTRTAAPKPRPKSAAPGKARPKSGAKDPENLYANAIVVTSVKKGKLAPEPSPRRGRRGRGDDGDDDDDEPEEEEEEEEDPNSNAILRPRTAGGSTIAAGSPAAAASPPSALRNRAPGATGSATGFSGPGPSRLGVSAGPSSSVAGGGLGAARPTVAFADGPPEARPPPPVRLDEPLAPAPASSAPGAAALIESKRKEAEETKDAATRLRELQERNRLKAVGGMGGLGLGATTPPVGGMGMGGGGGSGSGRLAQPYPQQQPQQRAFPHDVNGLAGTSSSGGLGEASFSAGKPRLAPLGGGPASGASAAGHQAAAAAAAASLGLSNSKKNLTWLVESPTQSRQGSVTAPHAAAVGIPGSLPPVSQQSLNVHAGATDGPPGHHGQSRFAQQQQQQQQQPASSTAHPMPRYSMGQLEAKPLAAAASLPRNPGGHGSGDGSAAGSAAGTASGAVGSATHSASGEHAVFAFASHIPQQGARPGNRAGGGASPNLAPIDGNHHPHHHSTPGTLGSSLGSSAHAPHGAAGYSSHPVAAGGGANFDGGAAGGGRSLQHQSSSGKGSFGRGGMQAPPQGLNLAATSPNDSRGARASPKADGGGGGGLGLASETANGPRTGGTGGFGLADEAYGARPTTPAEQRKEAAAANEAMLSSLLGGGGGVNVSPVKAHGVSVGAELERFDRVTEAMGRLDDLLAARPPSSAIRPRTALKSENPAADFPGSAAPGMGAAVSAW